MNESKIRVYFFMALLASLLLLVFLMFRPYLSAIVLAATMAVLVAPLHRKLAEIFSPREAWPAFLTCLIVFLVVTGPLTLLAINVFQEAKGFYLQLSGGGSGFAEIGQRLNDTVTRIVPATTFDVNDGLRRIVAWLSMSLGSIFAGIGESLVMFVFSLLTLFYFLKDGAKLRRFILAASPLPDSYDNRILDKLTIAVNSVIRGTLTVALIQGMLTGAGFAIFGVPNPALWGSLAVFAALIPSFGTSLVVIPGVVYLAATNASIPAVVGLSVWGAGLVGLIDNFLGPRLIGQRASLHPMLVFFSVLGGISVFGPIGFIVGPLTVSLLGALFEIYHSVIGRISDISPSRPISRSKTKAAA